MTWTTMMACLAAAMLAGAAASAADSTRPADPADLLAQTILQKANIHVGVCELPRVGDGTLAAALARQNVSVIQALAPDAATAQAARKPANDSNCLGSQVTVETGTPTAIPLQDWVADLLVVSDATDANLQEIPPAEVKRVLSPYRGVAIVGQPAGGKGLTAAALTAWANQLGGVADVKQDATGLWAVVKMPALAGGDDWSHYYHGADGNPVSKDTVLKGPEFGLQWMGGPYWAGKFDVHVAAGGREFHAQSTIYWRNNSILPWTLRARSLYNGQVLWERTIPKDFGDIGSLMVATPDRLYLKDGSGALALNAETGDELLRFGVQDKASDCKWLMLSDGVLVGMIGPKRTAEWGVGQGTGASFDAQQNYENETFYASEMDGWDAASGKSLWQFKEDRIDPAKTVIRDDRIYFYANYAYAACMDIKTGKIVWKTPAPIEQPKGPGMGLGWALNLILTPRQSAMVTDQVYLINSHAHLQSAAFAIDTGKLLWQKAKGKTSNNNTQTAQDVDSELLNYPIYFKGAFYDRTWRWSGWEPLTGKMIPGPTIANTSGCGHFTATETGLLFSQCGGVFDQGDHQWDVNDLYSKAACGVSQIPVDGTLIKVPADCPACTEWRGFIVAHSGSVDSPQGVRLEKGPAYDPTPATTSSDASDWATYRSTPQRSASSAAVVPADTDIRWTYAPPPPLKKLNTTGDRYSPLPRTQLSPPISVGDRIFFGTADGAIVCLDRASGQVLWQYWTGGQIMSAPTWAGGRIYGGSADGWVYALAADTGQLAWRYRVAPIDRQIMVFGRLSSPWPVLANVLVQGNVVYAAAGLVNTLGGSVLCALDAQTGQVKWEQDFFGTKEGAGPSAAGQLAYFHGTIFWHVANSGLLAVDAATGKMNAAPDLAAYGMTPAASLGTTAYSLNQTHGMDVGVIPGGWLALGGTEFFLPGDVPEEIRGRTVFMQTDASGAAQPELFALPKSQIRADLPAWDDKTVFVTGGEGAFGSKQPPAVPWLWKGFDAALDAVASQHPFKTPAIPKAAISLVRDLPIVPNTDQGQPAASPRLGRSLRIRWFDPVLAGNAAIMLGQNTQASGEGTLYWSLYIFSRADQTMLTKVRLPSPPTTNGLALTRAGDVLVSLVNGNLVCIGAPAAK